MSVHIAWVNDRVGKVDLFLILKKGIKYCSRWFFVKIDHKMGMLTWLTASG